jgi:two-component system NtrC family sensor kinase
MLKRFGLKKRFLVGSITALVLITTAGTVAFLLSFQKQILAFEHLVIGFAVFFIVSGVAGILVVSRIMVQPVLTLTEKIRQVQRGNLDVAVEMARRQDASDEMDALFFGFNEMVSKLRNNIVDLQSAKENAERITRQLQDGNKKLEAIFAGIPDGIMIVDRSFRVQFINPVMEKIMGKKPEEVIGKHCYASCQGLDTRCSFCRADSVFQLGGQAFTTCTKTPVPGSDERIMEIYDFPLYNESGEVERVIEYVRDVTETAKTQKNLEHAKNLAEIGKMASVVAHEVRNPLNAISGAVRYLNGEISDGNLRSYLDLIDEQVQRVSGVTDELLAYARPLKADFSRCQLKPIILKAINDLDRAVMEKKIRLETDLEASLPVLSLDAGQVERVFVNLLQNAIDAMEEGGKLEIVVHYRSEVPGNQLPQVEIEITDTGRGLAVRDPEELFKPFVTTKVRGTGLGLPIVRKIMDNHQGSVHLFSKNSSGTTAILKFPITLKVYESEKHHFSYR